MAAGLGGGAQSPVGAGLSYALTWSSVLQRSLAPNHMPSDAAMCYHYGWNS